VFWVWVRCLLPFYPACVAVLRFGVRCWSLGSARSAACSAFPAAVLRFVFTACFSAFCWVWSACQCRSAFCVLGSCWSLLPAFSTCTCCAFCFPVSAFRYTTGVSCWVPGYLHEFPAASVGLGGISTGSFVLPQVLGTFQHHCWCQIHLYLLECTCRSLSFWVPAWVCFLPACSLFLPVFLLCLFCLQFSCTWVHLPATSADFGSLHSPFVHLPFLFSAFPGCILPLRFLEACISADAWRCWCVFCTWSAPFWSAPPGYRAVPLEVCLPGLCLEATLLPVLHFCTYRFVLPPLVPGIFCLPAVLPATSSAFCSAPAFLGDHTGGVHSAPVLLPPGRPGGASLTATTTSTCRLPSDGLGVICWNGSGGHLPASATCSGGVLSIGHRFCSLLYVSPTTCRYLHWSLQWVLFCSAFCTFPGPGCCSVCSAPGCVLFDTTSLPALNFTMGAFWSHVPPFHLGTCSLPTELPAAVPIHCSRPTWNFISFTSWYMRFLLFWNGRRYISSDTIFCSTTTRWNKLFWNLGDLHSAILFLCSVLLLSRYLFTFIPVLPCLVSCLECCSCIPGRPAFLSDAILPGVCILYHFLLGYTPWFCSTYHVHSPRSTYLESDFISCSAYLHLFSAFSVLFLIPTAFLHF